MLLSPKGIISKLRQSYWIKSGALVFTTRLTLMVLGFFSFLILIRYLNKEEYGIWVIFMTITSLIETVRIGFLKNPIMILYADKTVKKSILYSTAFYLNMMFTFIIIIIILVFIFIWEYFFDHQIFINLFYLFIRIFMQKYFQKILQR